MFPMIYKYFIGIGLMLFGLFAAYFQEYHHPIYGYINLGKYHMFIGIASAISGAIYTAYIMRNKR
jgi:general stress protein CsbA